MNENTASECNRLILMIKLRIFSSALFIQARYLLFRNTRIVKYKMY